MATSGLYLGNRLHLGRHSQIRLVGGVQTKQLGFDKRRHCQLMRSIIADSLALTASGWFGLGWSDDLLRFPMCQFVKPLVVAFERFVEGPRLQKRPTFLAMAQHRLGGGLVFKDARST